MSPRTSLIASFITANALLVLIATTVWLNRPETPPLIQGVLLPDARELQTFNLIDHHGQSFSNRDLVGKWHLVSYGFTTCPDVCPTTLSVLSDLVTTLDNEGREPLNVLFYTVDHRRDTSGQLSAYLPFFHGSFLGLTHLDNPDNPHLPFEQGLGIFARLTPAEEYTASASPLSYEVSHGVTLFLLNPRGQLQAILEPTENQMGIQIFEAQQLYKDYLRVRQYVGSPGLASR